MRRVVLLLTLVIGLGAARAEALTVRDIIELSKTGLSDEVLIALIDVERPVFPVDPGTLTMLKQSGVSEKVIVAMVRSGRTQPPPMAAPALNPVVEYEPAPRVVQAPPVVIVEHHDVVREVPVVVPVYVPVVTVPRHPRREPQPIDAFVPRASIGLPHARIGLQPIYQTLPRRSDPPYWREMQQPRRD